MHCRFVIRMMSSLPLLLVLVFAFASVFLSPPLSLPLPLPVVRRIGCSAAWGSVYVKVTLGGTSWATSVFPSKDVGGYLLPVKAAVRKKEGVGEGDVVTVELSL